MNAVDKVAILVIVMMFSLLSSFITCCYIDDNIKKLEAKYASTVTVTQTKSSWVSDTTYYIRSTGRDTMITVRQKY